MVQFSWRIKHTFTSLTAWNGLWYNYSQLPATLNFKMPSYDNQLTLIKKTTSQWNAELRGFSCCSVLLCSSVRQSLEFQCGRFISIMLSSTKQLELSYYRNQSLQAFMGFFFLTFVLNKLQVKLIFYCTSPSDIYLQLFYFGNLFLIFFL